MLGAGTFGFLISTLFAPVSNSPHRQKVDNFLSKIRTPIDFENEIGEGNDQSQLLAIGRFGSAITGFIALLLLIPNPIEGRIAILTLALIIGAVSALMLKAGNKSTS